MQKRIRYLGVTWLFFAVILGGCAIKASNSVFGPREEVDIDYAAIFGEELTSFSMATGEKATLRRLQSEYSLKLDKYSKVIAIPYATSAKLVQTEFIGDTTLIVIAAPRNGCPQRHILYSITGKTGQFWELGGWGGCNAAPGITRRDETIFFDYPARAGVNRQTYYAGSLGQVQYLAPSQVQAAPKVGPTPLSASPSQRAAAPAQETPPRTGKPSTASSSASQHTGRAVSKSELPAPISFGESKVKPVTVVLD